MTRLNLVRLNKSRSQRVEFFVTRHEDIKKDKFDFRDENLRRGPSVSISLLRYQAYACKAYI